MCAHHITTAHHVAHLFMAPHGGMRVYLLHALATPHTPVRLALLWTWQGPDGGLRRALWSALTGGKVNSGWHIWYGSWWAVQMSACIGPVNLGVHADFRARRTGSGKQYGPYLDLHLPYSIWSVGVNPAYSGDLEQVVSSSRGGISGDHN